MIYREFFVLLVTLCFVSTLFGQVTDRVDPIKKLLFPPNLIMKNRAKLNLDDEQRNILKTELQQAQTDVFDLNWEMNEEGGKLAELLKQTPIDETELLAQADKVMTLEHQVKKRHLILLVRLKNMLSEQQIETLKKLRKEH